MKYLGEISNDKDLVNKEYVDEAVSGKQDTLVSGTNIKTVNNTSILGSGNISISGGSSIKYDGGRSQVSTSVTANSYTDFDYTFTTSFTSTPYVVVCLGASLTASNLTTLALSVTSVSRTGFTLRVANTSSASRRPTFDWIAIGE